MSTTTHVLPRPQTVNSGSPVRPSTARSTIRAITPSPSPPLSFDSALRLECACSGPPRRILNYDFLDHDSPVDDLQPFAHYVFDAKNKSPAGSPTNAQDPGLSSDGVPSNETSLGSSDNPSPKKRPSPPLKPRSRTQSPMQRPQSTPLDLPANQMVPAKRGRPSSDESEDSQIEWGSVDGTNDSDEQDFPDTPTPMTRTQKRQAYRPLGMSSPHFEGESPQNGRHEDSYAHSMSSSELMTTLQTNDHIPALPRTPPLAVYPMPPSPDSPPHQNLQRRPLSTSSASSSVIAPPRPAHLVALRSSYQLGGSSRAALSRHVSPTAVSNTSGITPHSVFSTPGRDEMERKKVSVEPDQGPFGRALSVQDLEDRRRKVAGEVHDKLRSGREGKFRKNKGGRNCGPECFLNRWLRAAAVG